MKAVINEKETPKQPEYPMLMKAESGMIVLMKEDKSGVVIANPVLIHMGQYVHDWPMHKFTPFTGSITLSND